MRSPVQGRPAADVLAVDISTGLDQKLCALETIAQHAVHQRCPPELVSGVQVVTVSCNGIVVDTWVRTDKQPNKKSQL